MTHGYTDSLTQQFIMTRKEALDFVNSLIKNKNLVKHMIATEAVMASLAERFGEDEEAWRVVGLLHDADYEFCKDDPDKHTFVLEEKIEEAGLSIDGDQLHAIQTHNHKHTHVQPKARLDWALICADDVNGLIIAAALVQPGKKLASVTLKSLKKKYKSKNFAAGVDRERIQSCEDKLGIPLDDFLQLSLESLQGVSGDLGL